MEKHDTSKERIIEASWQEFVDRGYDGARMQRIADNAGVNKAMIYYYFTSKDSLFESLLKSIFEKFFGVFFSEIAFDDLTMEELVRAFVEKHIEFLQKNPQLPKVIIRELHNNNPITGKITRKIFASLILQVFQKVDEKVRVAKDAGEIRDIDAMQTIWSIAGMNLFFFFMKPLLVLVLEAFDLEEDKVLEERKLAIIDLLLYGILPRE